MNNVMKINILLEGFLALMLFCSCGDNDEAFPSHMEKNWYVIEYDPNASELDRLIYEVMIEPDSRFFIVIRSGLKLGMIRGEILTRIMRFLNLGIYLRIERRLLSIL